MKVFNQAFLNKSMSVLPESFYLPYTYRRLGDGNWPFIKLFLWMKQVCCQNENWIKIWATAWQNRQYDARPAKIQTSLGIRLVWSETLLCALWVAKGPMLFHAVNEYSEQSGRTYRLIWVFAGRTCHFVGIGTMRLIWFQKFRHFVFLNVY